MQQGSEVGGTCQHSPIKKLNKHRRFRSVSHCNEATALSVLSISGRYADYTRFNTEHIPQGVTCRVDCHIASAEAAIAALNVMRLISGNPYVIDNHEVSREKYAKECRDRGGENIESQTKAIASLRCDPYCTCCTILVGVQVYTELRWLLVHQA
jgi:hypothetical protein